MHISFLFWVLSPRLKNDCINGIGSKRKNEKKREKGQMIATKKK